MTQKENRARSGPRDAAYCNDDVQQSDPYTLASHSSPTEMPKTALAAAYAEALARREGRA